MNRGRGLAMVGWAYAWLVLLFVLLPVVIMVPASFGSSETLEFPPRDYSLRWYAQVLGDRAWLGSAALSARLALIAALIATVAGLLLGVAHLLLGRIRPNLRAFLMLPIVAPHIVMATGLFSILLSFRALGDPTVLAIVHATLAVPLTMIVFVNAVDSIDPLLWTAARTLGARWWTIMRQIIMPLMLTSAIVAFVLALVVSWDEVTFAIFIGPSRLPTLPARMFYYLRELITPALTAVATLLVAATLMGGLLVLAINRFRRVPGPTETST